MDERILKRYAERVGYTPEETETFREGRHRVRHVGALARAAAKYSIVAEVIEAHNCNAGHVPGQLIVMDVDGCLITKFNPKRVCIYLAGALPLPVALINERLGEGLDPNDTQGFRVMRCPDTGVNCEGYGTVTVKVSAVPRLKEPPQG